MSNLHFAAFLIADAVLFAGLGVGGLLLTLMLWLLLGPGPRRARAFRRAERLLHDGHWSEALAMVRPLRQQRQPPAWEEKLQRLEGESLQAGGDEALKEGRFEEAHQHYQQAAALLEMEPSALRQHVVDAMLDAVRAHMAGDGANVAAAKALLERTAALQPASAEVHFWKALCLAREGPMDQAMASLDQAHQLGNRQHIDPPLYMGVLLHRQGKPQEALRVLAEANRVDAACPFVALQMGLSMVASGGDSGIAVRVLQKALGPRGLPMWGGTPHRAWVEAFPSGKSFVRRLAEKHAYACPVLGGDLKALIRLGEMALGQAYYRQGAFQESADVFNKLLSEAAPTLPVLRGLGLALTRLGRHDQAFKHLRAAVEMDPQHGLTAGYLALCGAKGKPAQPEDRPRNVQWAVKQVSRFDGTGNAEYAAIMNAIHAEARAINLDVAREDQARLCHVLASVKAHDPDAADGYLQLARRYPADLRDEFAWLYGRAAVAHEAHGDGELDVLARVFRDRAAAQTYFAQQKWDLEEVELLYLERFAERQPGGFPPALGADYPPRGEELLLARSEWLEEMKDLDGALRSVGVLLRLAPRSLAGHDRAACLYHRKGDGKQALRFLGAAVALAPSEPLPLVRRAIVEQQQGEQAACLASLQKALSLARGGARASVALIAGRLMLASWNASKEDAGVWLERAEGFLVECLRENPDHVEGCSLLAALRASRGDDKSLAALVPHLRAEVEDARYQLMAAVCWLVAGDAARAAEAARKVEADAALAPEGRFILAWAHVARGDDTAAFQALQQAAAATGPSAELARGLLGRVAFQKGAYSETVRWWSGLPAERQAEWNITEPLRQTILLAGLVALKTGQYEQAAERFREAGKLGLRDRRLGPLIGLSLFKAGQRLLYQE
jgi:tetratricopeptide (TPR) repeat protein